MKVNLACRIDCDKGGRVVRATSVMLAHGMPHRGASWSLVKIIYHEHWHL
jgi:hypothetical protein